MEKMKMYQVKEKELETIKKYVSILEQTLENMGVDLCDGEIDKKGLDYDLTLLHLYKRKKETNKKVYERIANKRIFDKQYARSK